MGQEDEKDDEVPVLDDLDPSSGTQKKKGSDELKLIVASFQQRSQGLDGEDLEFEINRLMDKLIERSVKIAPEGLKPEARALLRSQLENDPTLRQMLDDLRAGAKKRGNT